MDTCLSTGNTSDKTMATQTNTLAGTVGLKSWTEGEVDALSCLGPLSWEADLKYPALKV